MVLACVVHWTKGELAAELTAIEACDDKRRRESWASFEQQVDKSTAAARMLIRLRAKKQPAEGLQGCTAEDDLLAQQVSTWSNFWQYDDGPCQLPREAFQGGPLEPHITVEQIVLAKSLSSSRQHPSKGDARGRSP